MTVPGHDLAFYAREVAEVRTEIDDVRADFQILAASHEHDVAAHRVDEALLTEYRRCLVALLGDNLPAGHRGWVLRLLARRPVPS